MRPLPSHAGRGLVVLLAITAAAWIAAGGSPAAAARKCVGAAAHDPAHPCVNPTFSVVPPPGDESRRPAGPPCKPAADDGNSVLLVCTFGVPAARASSHVAFIGDSHALRWQPALDVVARADGWHVSMLERDGCIFSGAAAHMLPGPREGCEIWYRAGMTWLRSHPDIHTIFIAVRATTPVSVPPGSTTYAVKSAGLRRTLRALPRTVRHVVVIRDVPESSNAQFNCLGAVLAAGALAPGPACPMAPAAALRWDTSVSTIAALRSSRYRSIDMTDFFCDGSTCPLVIGGVLVHVDVDHITPTYSRSLGPYLLRRVRALGITAGSGAAA